MICPHCSKAIPCKERTYRPRFEHLGPVSNLTKMRILTLHGRGISTRKIEKMLFKEGMQASYSTVSRIIKAAKEKA